MGAAVLTFTPSSRATQRKMINEGHTRRDIPHLIPGFISYWILSEMQDELPHILREFSICDA